MLATPRQEILYGRHHAIRHATEIISSVRDQQYTVHPDSRGSFSQGVSRFVQNHRSPNTLYQLGARHYKVSALVPNPTCLARLLATEVHQLDYDSDPVGGIDMSPAKSLCYPIYFLFAKQRKG